MNQTNNQFPVRVMMEQTVIEAINNMAFRNPNLEDGGILLGNIATDPVTGHPVIVVSELYYESHPEHQKSSTYTFSPDYKLRALTHCTDFYSRHHSDRRPVGNVHSHARHPAFLSGVDKQMMASSPGEQVYLVISPSHYNCVAVYVDDQHNLHECTIAVIGGDEFKVGRTVQTDHPSYRQAGNSFPAVSYRVCRNYNDAQSRELEQRFLHSVQSLAEKKVLVVGAGTIGSLVIQNLVHSGIADLTIIDNDYYGFQNMPRTAMVTTQSEGKSKALEMAAACARNACFPLEVTGIHANIYDLGWTFLKDFDLVLSPVDSVAARMYLDRGCHLYHVPHITVGSGVMGGDFTGNVIFFPTNSSVDLEYVWGRSWRTKMEEKVSCADIQPEIQPQVMGFSAQLAGMTSDLALKVLLGKTEDDTTVCQYLLNALGHGYDRDNNALRCLVYKRLPKGSESELYGMIDKPIIQMTFDRALPKEKLWNQFRDVLGEDIQAFRMNLLWSMNFPLCYSSVNTVSCIAVAEGSGVDENLGRLPDSHVYLVEGEEDDYLVELTLTEPIQDS